MNYKNGVIAAVSLLLVIQSVSVIHAQKSGNENGWVELFNGRDLTGWYTYQKNPEPTSEVPGLPRDDDGNYLEPIGLNEDPLNVFSVVEEDGAPAVRISGETFGILVTEEEYENYHLRLEFKWGEKKFPPRQDLKRDSGVLYHSIGPEGAWYGVWMMSQEFQVQETDCGDFINVDSTLASIPAVEVDGEYRYREGADRLQFNVERAYCNHSRDYEKPHGEWNTLEVYTIGDTSIHVVNGQVNLRAYDNRYMENGKIHPLTRGKIQIQSEGAEVYYRNIRLRPIEEYPAELLPASGR